MRAVILILGTAPFLAACDLGDFTNSEFRSAGATGISVSLDNELNGSLDGASGTVHFTSGTDDDGAQAFAGISSVGTIGVEPSVTTFYTTQWQTVGIGMINVVGDDLTGFNQTDGGAMVLTFDPTTGSVTGSDTGTYGTLQVDGTITGTDLGGAVTYAGVEGSLDGRAGTEGLIGAFHGNSDTRVYAGGLRSIAVAD